MLYNRGERKKTTNPSEVLFLKELKNADAGSYRKLYENSFPRFTKETLATFEEYLTACPVFETSGRCGSSDQREKNGRIRQLEEIAVAVPDCFSYPQDPISLYEGILDDTYQSFEVDVNVEVKPLVAGETDSKQKQKSKTDQLLEMGELLNSQPEGAMFRKHPSVPKTR